PARLQALLEDHCTSCHDGSADGERDLRTPGAVDRRMVLEAALKVGATDMPPPPAELTFEERLELALELCRFGAVADADCQRFYAPRADGVLARRPSEYVRLARTRTGKPAKARTLDPEKELPAATMIEARFPPYERVVHVDPTAVIQGTLLADEECPAQGTSPRGAQAFKACAGAVLDPAGLQLPRPVSPGGGQP
ncbi:MAG: hypothetical protein K1X89_28850, partial [Myxococcaceae bacterium]|nr:hypothetical protein [Myxococcaceae bacterium]